MTQNTDYGVSVQKLYLNMMLEDATTFARCQSIFDSTLFDRTLRPAAKFIQDHAEQHTALPTMEMVEATTKVKFEKLENLRPEHFDWLLNEFETFTRHKALERAILESADMLEQGHYGTVEDKIKKAVQIGLTRDLGTDYWLDPKSRLDKIKDRNGQISTGWTTLDKILFGGFSRGELEIFAAASGGGKSLFLANLGVNWALAGHSVLYLTFELSEELVAMRIDSMITGIPSRDIFKKIDDVELKVKTISKGAGDMQIKYLPSGKNANDIRAYIKEYEIKSSRKIDVLLVDYLDLMMPINKKIAAENLFIKDKFVSEELRNLAMEKNCIVVSASQLNRGAAEEVEFDHSHISGGLSKIQTADNVFGIYTSRAMRERGLYQVQLMKTRNSSGVGQKLDLAFDIDTLRITDLPEDHTSHSPSDIMTSIKTRSNAVATEESPKSKIGSAKLRDLINNLPEDDI